ncbi:NADPH-dependent FMN reductase [Sistotremastrum niveocremeum HHB9708]|uniref:NADPH-dependent FMN reductase n=2 Tax=Sistotremastraceae TaxID=3402574 RepID=A0A164MWY4_9AGAM|nr:NADPH-dependent FMN reductase [Sistotremastrum niveocremeum HHB9708]KZT32802.1 NADPH-dependent FMN reductase [Sistotremastrum suecicum HHB10207 ss-3]
MTKVALIVGSIRAHSSGAQIATYLTSTSTPSPLPSVLASHDISLETISLAELALPPFTEDIVPQAITPPNYPQPEVSKWSTLVSSFDGFIFLTPQYNWGYPASLKNALDHLFKEWVGKPALIISYGGRGGGKAAAQLKIVTAGGLDMRVAEKTPALSLPRGVITGPKTVSDDTSFLDVFAGDLKEGVEEFVALVNEKKE